jgi:hypothetical protein
LNLLQTSNRPGDYIADGSRPQGLPTQITLAAFTMGGADAQPTVVLSNRVHYVVSRGIIVRPEATILSASRSNPGLTSTEFLKSRRNSHRYQRFPRYRRNAPF